MNKLEHTKIPTTYHDIRTDLRLKAIEHFGLDSAYFEGSNISRLIDIFSYSILNNNVNFMFGINESFLSTSNVRKNILNHAYNYGYIPRLCVPTIWKTSVKVSKPTQLNLKGTGLRSFSKSDNANTLGLTPKYKIDISKLEEQTDTQINLSDIKNISYNGKEIQEFQKSLSDDDNLSLVFNSNEEISQYLDKHYVDIKLTGADKNYSVFQVVQDKSYSNNLKPNDKKYIIEVSADLIKDLKEKTSDSTSNDLNDYKVDISRLNTYDGKTNNQNYAKTFIVSKYEDCNNTLTIITSENFMKSPKKVSTICVEQTNGKKTFHEITKAPEAVAQEIYLEEVTKTVNEKFKISENTPELSIENTNDISDVTIEVFGEVDGMFISERKYTIRDSLISIDDDTFVVMPNPDDESLLDIKFVFAGTGNELPKGKFIEITTYHVSGDEVDGILKSSKNPPKISQNGVEFSELEKVSELVPMETLEEIKENALNFSSVGSSLVTEEDYKYFVNKQRDVRTSSVRPQSIMGSFQKKRMIDSNGNVGFNDVEQCNTVLIYALRDINYRFDQGETGAFTISDKVVPELKISNDSLKKVSEKIDKNSLMTVSNIPDQATLILFDLEIDIFKANYLAEDTELIEKIKEIIVQYFYNNYEFGAYIEKGEIIEEVQNKLRELNSIDIKFKSLKYMSFDESDVKYIMLPQLFTTDSDYEYASIDSDKVVDFPSDGRYVETTNSEGDIEIYGNEKGYKLSMKMSKSNVPILNSMTFNIYK